MQKIAHENNLSEQQISLSVKKKYPSFVERASEIRIGILAVTLYQYTIHKIVLCQFAFHPSVFLFTNLNAVF